MHKRLPAKGLSPMEKRVPKNEKYANVKSTLDTGLTVDKVKFVTAREYSKRRDEIFYRISKHQLYELYNAYEQDEYESISETAKTGEDVRVVTYTENSRPEYNKPYLILDVREPHNYNIYHLLQARTFPYTMLRRDQLHPEVYAFRNKPETLIIVCCDDERISSDCAKVMVDRGIDNVYLLSGGMAEFAFDYPAFVEGIPPMPPKGYATTSRAGISRGPSSGLGQIPEDGSFTGGASASRQQRGNNSSSSSSGALTPGKLQAHNRSYAAKSGNAVRTSLRGDAYSESGATVVSSKSVAESVISKAASRKGKF